MERVISHISGKVIAPGDAVKGETLRSGIFNLIRKDFPDFSTQSFLSSDEVNKFRRDYLASLMSAELADLNQMEHEVVSSISNNQILSENIELKLEEKQTPGQRIADKIAEFGGSWTFIICFFLVLLTWILVNVIALGRQAFDPYPFILLNLILSCLAAIQAPVIMMSQNRKEAKDRLRSEYDYKVNLKAELEIRLLHEKLDHLMIHQNQRLLDIQQLQTDYLEEITARVRHPGFQ